MKKRLIAALIFAFTMIYLSISVSAVPTFDSQSYYIAFRKNTSSGSWKSATAGNFPYTLTSENSSINSYVFLGYKTNQIIADNSIIVATIKVDNIEDINLLGAGQPTSATLFTQTGITYAEMMEIPLTQEIIASTSIQLGDAIQHTVTFKAKGYKSQNAVIGYRLGAIKTSGSAITLVNCDLYESIQEAASSGTTPEEMREVLSSWSEEELIPGIGEEVGDQIENKVPGAVEDALNNHDQHQENQAGSKIDEFKEQLEETINPYFENTTEIRDALHGGLTGVFGYSGTNAVITFPAANNPMADGAVLWPELTVDLGYWWNRLPAALRSMITIYATFVILYCCLSEMLDTINTILIHRELLGMPDDAFGIKAKSWSE